MHRRLAGLCVLYLLVWTVTAVMAFLFGDFLPLGVGYVFLVSLYVLPVLAIRYEEIPLALMAAVLVSTPLLTFLIVIDPVEMGLFGHDPYVYTMPALESFRTGSSLAAFMNEGGEWPAFYALFVFVEQVTDVPTYTLAKYLPLMSAAVPLFYFVAVSRYTSRRIAFLSAIAIASVRTLFLFESKFVNEIVAVVLFFVLLVVLRFFDFGWPENLLPVVVVLALTFAHHATAYIAVLFLGCWAFVDWLSRIESVPERFVSRQRDLSDVRLRHALILGIVITSLFIYMASVVSKGLLGIAYSALVLGQTTPAPISQSSADVGTISGLPIRQLVSRAALVVLGVLAAISGVSVLSRYRAQPWEVGWTAFAGIISVLYVGTIVGGRAIHLDPIRLLLFLVAALVPPALTVLVRSTGPDFLAGWSRHTVATAIVCAFLVTQIAAIPPHVLYSDPSSTTLDEGHYTPAQFAASSWAGTHSDAAVLGYEKGLWIARGAGFRAVQFETDGCDDTMRVWRIEAGEEMTAADSTIYDGGDVALTTCNGS